MEMLKYREVVTETFCDKTNLTLCDGEQSNQKMTHVFHQACVYKWF
jgi:hypothetical protein